LIGITSLGNPAPKGAFYHQANQAKMASNYFKLRVKASTVVDVWYWIGKEGIHLFEENNAFKFNSKDEIQAFLKKRKDICHYQIAETIVSEEFKNK
jgi:hypothetical protein